MKKNKKKCFILIYILFFNLKVDANELIKNSWKSTDKENNSIKYAENKVLFKGKNKKELYINGAKNSKLSWNIKNYKIIKFNFKYKENYVFMISLKTEQGYRTLMYLPKRSSTKTYIGLGEGTKDGQWHTIERNLEEDLQRTESNNHIVSVNAFICRGTGEFGLIKFLAKKEDKPWRSLSGLSTHISQVYDKEKKKKVIEFKNFTGKESYIYRFSKKKRAKTIEWEFKYNKNFVILISVFTQDGYRTLIYTAQEQSGQNAIGLNLENQKNRWTQVKRDLELDLKQIEPDNRLLYINAFIYRGDGFLSQIKTVEEDGKKLLKRGVLETIVSKIMLLKKDNCHFPYIELLGEKKVYLPLNGQYDEAGVLAYDCDHNSIPVEILSEIDTQREGEKILNYMATDKRGNVITVSRVVIVGEKKERQNIVNHREVFSLPMIESDGVDEEYEAIKHEIETELIDMDYEVGDEIIL